MGSEQSSEAQAGSSDADGASQKFEPQPLVIVGPSGVGKGTLINRLLEENQQYFSFSVSHTTRQPREDEQNGKHYHFSSMEDMRKDIADGKFLEYAEVHGNLYGTSKQAVREVLGSGRCCILEIDVQGVRQVRKAGLNAVYLFVAPPSLETLEQRLRSRGTEKEADVAKRLGNAMGEISSLTEEGLYDYVVINGDLNTAYNELVRVAARAIQGLGPDGRLEMPQQLRSMIDSLTTSNKPAQAASEGAAAQDGADAPEQAGSAAASAAAESSGGEHTEGGELRLTPAEARKEASGQLEAGDSAGVITVPPGMEKWVGKVALVTGASAGIGWSTCQALALAGMRVIAVARRRERLEQLQSAVLVAGIDSASFLPIVCDITKEGEVAALPAIAEKRWPGCGVDVLVNNAGMARSNASLFNGSTQAWAEMVSTNVLGLCMCTREVLKTMEMRGSWGHVINISSMSGHRVVHTPAGGGFYAATKHAVRALTEGLRLEARGKGVPLRVSEISPGLVETEFAMVSRFGDVEAARKLYDANPALNPVDVAQTVLWCLSAPAHMEVNDVLVRPTAQMQ